MRVRPEERSLALWLAALFAVTQAGHGLGANAADALFFVRFGVEFLPQMILASGLALIIALLVYGAGLGRLGTRRFLPLAAWTLGAILVIERALVVLDVPAVYAAIWLTEQVVIITTFTLMWNAASRACDARQAKRLFPLFASAGIAGGFVGNAVTGPLAHTIGTANVLVVHAGLLAISGMFALRVGSRYFSGEDARPASAVANLRSGFRDTVDSPYLRLVALSSIAFSLLFFLVFVPFSGAATASFPDERELATFLGLFSAIATLLSFVVSLVVANRLFARFGVVATLLVVPVVYVAGLSLWAVEFTLVTATLVRGAQWVVVNGIGATAVSSLYNVVEPSRRGRVMAFIGGVPAQLGVVLAGVLLVAGTALLDTAQIAAAGAVVALAATLVVIRMRRAYAGALLDALRSGVEDVFTAPAHALPKPDVDADALRAVGHSLADPDARVRRLVADMLGRLPGTAALDPLLDASADDDPTVRAAVARSLGTIRDERATRAALVALRDPEAIVRREAVGALAVSPERLAAEADGVLTDPDPHVRASAAALVRGEPGRDALDQMLAGGDTEEVDAALAALVAWEEGCQLLDVERFLDHDLASIRLGAARAMLAHGKDKVRTAVGLLDDPEPSVRSGVARMLRGRRAATDDLVAVLEGGSERAQEAAVEALAGHPGVHQAVVTWALEQTTRAADLSAYRTVSSDERMEPEARHYLRRVLGQRQSYYTTRALRAVEVLSGREALHLLTTCANARDPQLRAQALEAVDAISDRVLTRRLLPLLEEEGSATGADVPGDLWPLLDDRDPWLRALAARTLDDELERDRTRLAQRVEGDRSPLVRDAVRRREVEAMHEQKRPLERLIDRVLALQRVAMFADLAPEDLERIALRCEERRYADGETIYRYGEPGAEMLVIAEGSVHVRRHDGTTPERVLRPGEHVGELALLRARPRAADVVAEGSVAGLALGADDLRAVLDSRPEVAMAMLATLAERLGADT